MTVIKLMNVYVHNGRTFTVACSQTQAVACCFSASNVSIENILYVIQSSMVKELGKALLRVLPMAPLAVSNQVNSHKPAIMLVFIIMTTIVMA